MARRQWVKLNCRKPPHLPCPRQYMALLSLCGSVGLSLGLLWVLNRGKSVVRRVSSILSATNGGKSNCNACVFLFHLPTSCLFCGEREAYQLHSCCGIMSLIFFLTFLFTLSQLAGFVSLIISLNSCNIILLTNNAMLERLSRNKQNKHANCCSY